ncbi:glycosyltransferase family 2 protein [Hymenobacter wooponensis]|uniref:Glycosyltransferase n=1 Tax=Hymenobacter wooponensis TaxID=1525360 RepID=A0A4Z0MSA9_9BACT|nr:glycosyltransferase [Hymenobacter wooponensis]TGD82228.1 glycosyltransferase [Hymenobacter wooponensis]
MAPTVSVILPVYNQEPYLAETIESVLAQSFTDFELLILDDGSKDGSADIIRRYAARDPRIRAFFGPNAGRCEATNKLLAQAVGTWCALLDADDVMLPERLARQVAFHEENPEVDATSCHCYYINHKGDTLGTQRYPFVKNVAECRKAAATGEFIQCAMTGLMVSREVLEQTGGLRSKFWPCDDFELFNRLIAEGYVLVIMQEALMKYRIHESAITVRNPFHTFDMIGYTMHCLTARRAQEPEITFEEFMAIRQAEPWLTRFNRKRFNYSQIFFRNAGFSMMSKNYLNFLWQASTATALSPGYMLLKVRNLARA